MTTCIDIPTKTTFSKDGEDWGEDKSGLVLKIFEEEDIPDDHKKSLAHIKEMTGDTEETLGYKILLFSSADYNSMNKTIEGKMYEIVISKYFVSLSYKGDTDMKIIKRDKKYELVQTRFFKKDSEISDNNPVSEIETTFATYEIEPQVYHSLFNAAEFRNIRKIAARASGKVLTFDDTIQDIPELYSKVSRMINIPEPKKNSSPKFSKPE